LLSPEQRSNENEQGDHLEGDDAQAEAYPTRKLAEPHWIGTDALVTVS
jgi:hypothetical protein